MTLVMMTALQTALLPVFWRIKVFINTVMAIIIIYYYNHRSRLTGESRGVLARPTARPSRGLQWDS